MGTPTFVVVAGAGRCSAWMLLDMLREHPRVLSLPEFFLHAADGMMTTAAPAEAFSAEAVDGRRFWSIVSAIKPYFNCSLKLRVGIPELLYPCDAPTARFSRETGVPGFLMTTLPYLTGDHDRLFELVEAEVVTWPTGTIGEHYGHLFDWLAKHFGKRTVVEGGGGKFGQIDQIKATFPDARFIHLVRDGRDMALCQREHMGNRFATTVITLQRYLGVNPLESSDRTHMDKVPAEWRGFLPEDFDLDALRSLQIPSPVCAKAWAQQIEDGMKALHLLPADRLLTLRYEDILADPKHQLDTLAGFLGDEFVDEDWSTRCAATVRPPRSTWRDLPEDEARALTEACRPGFELLHSAGVEYDF